MSKKVQVEHDCCILCGLCVMMGFADKKEGKIVIKPDLSSQESREAEQSCPVGAIIPADD